MWCPSASLAVWANAWLAGQAAPDDVLDALSQWAPRHSVTAYDSVAAGSTGLPWPDLNDAGAVSLLQTLRTAAGPRTDRRTRFEHRASGAGRRPGAARGHHLRARRRRHRRGPCRHRRAAAPRSGWSPISSTTIPVTTTPNRSSSRFPTSARCHGRCTRCPPLPCPSTSTSAKPSSPCAQRCARRPMRWAGCVPAEPVWTSTIRVA